MSGWWFSSAYCLSALSSDHGHAHNSANVTKLAGDAKGGTIMQLVCRCVQLNLCLEAQIKHQFYWESVGKHFSFVVSLGRAGSGYALERSAIT